MFSVSADLEQQVAVAARPMRIMEGRRLKVGKLRRRR
jgi:hypothetical protein